MKKRLLNYLSACALAFGIVGLMPAPATAQVNVFQNCGGNGGSAICQATGNTLFGAGSIWNKILNTIIFVTGSVAVLMIIVGGLRYALSGGDQGSISSAKNTILYAVIGLILAVSGYAIVNFVLSRV